MATQTLRQSDQVVAVEGMDCLVKQEHQGKAIMADRVRILQVEVVEELEELVAARHRPMVVQEVSGGNGWMAISMLAVAVVLLASLVTSEDPEAKAVVVEETGTTRSSNLARQTLEVVAVVHDQTILSVSDDQVDLVLSSSDIQTQTPTPLPRLVRLRSPTRVALSM